MTIVLNGTTGITNVNGTAAAPAETGTDTDSGIVYGTNTVSLATNGTTALTVDASQNVGIGTSSPSAKLDVTNGSAAANCIIKITNSGTWGAYMQGVTSNRTFSYGAFDLTNGFASGTWGVRDETAAAWRMLIDNSGNLLVGTTSGAGERISVVAPSGNAAMSVQVSANGNAGVNFKNVSSTTVGQIVVNAATTAYNTSSDYRLKENIQSMAGALAKVAELKPVTYTWKSTGEASEGFIAHELQTVIPDCVTGEKDAVETYTDEDGNEQTRPKYQGIDTSFLVATLTAAIQELKALTDAQASTITSLTARITALETK